MEAEPSTVPSATGEASASLAARIRSGDRSAEEELVNTYRRGVLLIAGVRTRDREAARDLAQEVLIVVLKALREGQLREPDKLAAFVQGTTRNIVNNYIRTRARRPECDLDSVSVPSTDPVVEFESAERQRLVRRELESFSMTDQQILLLSMVDGHSLAEVARRLNLSHEAVRARKSRMVRKIMKKFGHVSQK